jgi:hypothetical protein
VTFTATVTSGRHAHRHVDVQGRRDRARQRDIGRRRRCGTDDIIADARLAFHHRGLWGSASFTTSTSPALIQAVSTPPDSLKLRAMQALVAPVVAPLSFHGRGYEPHPRSFTDIT